MKLKLFLATFILTLTVGCTPNIEETLPSFTNKLQITYIRIKEDQTISELYTIDISCITTGNICFDEPKLLLQSLSVQSSEQNLPKGFITGYYWSPDGNKIALISTGEILVGDMNMQSWTNVTNTPNIDEDKPKWSPDNKFIFYLACPRIIEGIYGGHGSCKLYRLNLSTNEKLELPQSNDDSIYSYDISPDKKEIAFTVSGHFAVGELLFLANADGTNSHQITGKGASETMPSFSPDGKKIAFVRSSILYDASRKEEQDIIVKDLITGKEKNLTEDYNGLVFFPIFSPDGKLILFEAFDSELNVNIFLVSLEQGNVVQVTKDNEGAYPAWRQLSE